MSKIISIVKNGVRYDLPLELEKGGPGSGRYPKGSGGERQSKEESGKDLSNHVDILDDFHWAVKNVGTDRSVEGLIQHMDKEYPDVPWKVKAEAIKILESELDKEDKFNAKKMTKQEPIAIDEPIISRGAIVSLNGHKGKVLDVTGNEATVSWEDASLSKVPVSGLKYEGRVEG